MATAEKKKPAPKKKTAAKPAAKKPPIAYAWDKILNGKKNTLKKGTDYHATQQSMYIQIRRAASAMGKKVAISMPTDGRIIVQAYKKGQKRPDINPQ